MKTEIKKGGARKGSGRKPKDPTEIINFRVPKGKGVELKPLVADYIKSLLNPNEKTTDFSNIEDKEKFKSDWKELTKQPAKEKIKTSKPTTSEPTLAELLRQTYSK